MLDVYLRPYDAKRPVICMDAVAKNSSSAKSESRFRCDLEKSGRSLTQYMRFGLAEFRRDRAVERGNSSRSATDQNQSDWAKFIKRLIDEEYADAEKIVLVRTTPEHAYGWIAVRSFLSRRGTSHQ